MKEVKKKQPVVPNVFGLELTIDESLDKYKSAELESPKSKKLRNSIAGPVIIHQ